MERSDSDTMAVQVFKVVFSGAVLFMLAVILFVL